MSRLETFTPEGGVWRSLRGSDTPTVDPDPGPVESLSLLVSSVELEMWRDRKDNGPFRATGDFQTNSPGHWNEMNNARNRNFADSRWSGPTNLDNDGKVLRGGTDNDPPGDVRRSTHDLMSASYAAMILDDTATASTAIGEIEWHAQQSRLDFGNRTLYPYSYYADRNPLFMYADWVKDFALAYDVCRAMGVTTSAQRATIEGWFYDLADLCEQSLHNGFSNDPFPSRKEGIYSDRASWVDETTSGNQRRFDGQVMYTPRISGWYNNRKCGMAGMVGYAGLLGDDQTLIDEYKRFMRELVMFGHSIQGESQGSWFDPFRAEDGFPQKGLSYGFRGWRAILGPMDALARQGDTELYEFSSSDGADIGSRGTKHTKSMEQVIDLMMRWVRRTWPAHYASGTRPHPENLTGDEYYRVHSRHTGLDREIITDGWFLLPANFYGRQDWADTVLRVNHPQFPAYTSVFITAGTITGARTDWRHRFLRSLDANPYGGA